MCACFKCKHISKFIVNSKSHEKFMKDHCECDGRFTSWYPSREDGRNHAVMSGIPYGLANGSRVQLTYD